MTSAGPSATIGLVALVAVLCASAVGAQEPAPLVGAKIGGRVAFDSATGIFTYDYRVENPSRNTSAIGMVDLDLTESPDEPILWSADLSAPRGWLVGLGRSDAPVTKYWAGWGAVDLPNLIRAGQRLGGFMVRSRGLPALRDGALLVDIDLDKLPPEYFGDVDRMRVLRQRTTSEVVTVGPKAPPKHFVAIEYVNYLLAMVYESGRQRWISNPNDEAKLVRRLRDAKRRLEAGQLAHAAKRVQQFLREAEHEACWEFECSGRKGLTSEATALFVFNARYLLERLPPATAEDVPD